MSFSGIATFTSIKSPETDLLNEHRYPEQELRFSDQLSTLKSFTYQGSNFTQLKLIREILNGYESNHKPFTFHVHGIGSVDAVDPGLEGIVSRAVELVNKGAIQSIAHHAGDLVKSVSCLILKSNLCENTLNNFRDFGYIRPTLLNLYSNNEPWHDISKLINNLSSDITHIGAPLDFVLKLNKLYTGLRERNYPNESIIEPVVLLIKNYCESLQTEVRKLNHASWFENARAYHIFPRAFNLEGFYEAFNIPSPASTQLNFFKDFPQEAFDYLKEDLAANTIYLTGINPLGSAYAIGNAGGSPFCLKDYESIDAKLGTNHDFQSFIARAHKNNIRVMTDVIFNHTSFDSKLLSEDPTLFIHLPATLRSIHAPESIDLSNPEHYDPAPDGYNFYFHQATQKGYFIRMAGFFDADKNSRCYYRDVAQLDLFNPDTRERLISGLLDFLKHSAENDSGYGIDALRVDMGHHLLNDRYQKSIRGADCPNQHPIPEREFLEELISAVKSEFPHVAFLAEGHENLHNLRSVGFDAIQSKNNCEIDFKGHRSVQYGWYDNLVTGRTELIRQAILRKAYEQSNEGTTQSMQYLADHDLKPIVSLLPKNELEMLRPLLALSNLVCSSTLHEAGHENLGFYQREVLRLNDQTPRFPAYESISTINWLDASEDTLAIHRRVAKDIRALESELGAVDIAESFSHGHIIGVLLRPRDTNKYDNKYALLIANLEGQDRIVSMPAQDLNHNNSSHTSEHLYATVKGYDYSLTIVNNCEA
jgi:glycosidase